MKSLFSGILFIALSIYSFSSYAKEVRHHGCHHTHNKAGKLKPLTAHEKVLLNESIARSDTFDILSYLIHLDVTNYVGQEIKAATTIAVSPWALAGISAGSSSSLHSSPS